MRSRSQLSLTMFPAGALSTVNLCAKDWLSSWYAVLNRFLMPIIPQKQLTSVVQVRAALTDPGGLLEGKEKFNPKDAQDLIQVINCIHY